MSGNGKAGTVKIILDDEEVEVPAGINLVEAAALHGKEVPHYCYHPKLTVAGNCRMCLVEMGMPMRDRGTGEPVLDEDGNQKIGWIPKPIIGCGTDVVPGMHVKTASEMAEGCREGIWSFFCSTIRSTVPSATKPANAVYRNSRWTTGAVTVVT